MTWLLLAAVAWPNELVDALTVEMERGVEELSLPDAPPIYHLRYHLLQLDQVDVTAAFGALLHEGGEPFNAVAVEVRVGSPEFDNTNFGGWQTGFDRAWLPRELTPHVLRQTAWRMTDTAYKQAVEQYARKSAQFDPPPDYPGDYTLVDAPSVDDLGHAGIGEAGPLRHLAREVSAAMSVDPRIERAEVHVGHEAGSLWTIDTEGTRLRHPVQETTVRALVHVRADDGMLLTDDLVWTVRRPGDLPSLHEMTSAARAMARGLVATADAPAMDDEYVGPVLFEGEAAVDLFRYLLVPQLEGTPGEIPFDTWLGEIGAADDPVRLRRRVLPPGWEVVDDPAADPSHPASFVYDAEGSPAERVALVSDGIVQDVLLSRIPRRGTDGTNGHARGLPGERLSGRASMLTVTPDRPLPEGRVRRQALRTAAAYGLDHVIVVRDLQEPSVRQRASGPMGSGSDTLPPPVSVVRLYADGREEPVRGADFAGVQRWVLRDVIASRRPAEASFLAAPRADAFGQGPTEGLPTRVTAPEVLVGELEIVPAPGDPRARPVVPPPAVTID